MSYFVESGAKGLVSVRYVTEVAFDPFGIRWYVEGERFWAAVGDLCRLVGVAGGAKAANDESYVRELCWLASLLARA